jgi:aminoglycoside 6-adenylyltransferase
MRSEAKMFELIIQTARDDQRIRAVTLNGSRVNESALKDVFQDFDIVYLVTELESFKANPGWIDHFGERMVMQLPDDFGEVPPPDRYAYLIQFKDGHRLDLTLKTGFFDPDSLSMLLLDKDGTTPKPPPPTERDYQPQPPTPKAFFETCNEFWWVAPYVAKGLWRGEISYAQSHLEILREQLFRTFEWFVGIRTDFQKSIGNKGKHLSRLLSPHHWVQLQKTYSDADLEHTWDALLSTVELFREIALVVAEHFQLPYPHEDDRRVTAHLKHVRQLPRNAKMMY